MYLNELSRLLRDAPTDMLQLPFQSIVQFCDIVTWLRPEIVELTQYRDGVPPQLPTTVHNFLMAALGLPDETLKIMWQVFGVFAWYSHEAEPAEEVHQRIRALASLFLQYGLPHDIGEFTQTVHHQLRIDI